jgi:hypothetical protein
MQEAISERAQAFAVHRSTGKHTARLSVIPERLMLTAVRNPVFSVHAGRNRPTIIRR